MKADIFIYGLSKIMSQQHLFMTAWKDDKTSKVENKDKKTVNMVKNLVALNKSKSPDSFIEAFNKLPPSLNNAIIGKRSKSMTHPFLITFEIFNPNVQNCLVDSGVSFNIMSYIVCKKINVKP